MSLELPYGVKRLTAGPLDPYYGPYNDVATALASVPIAVRLKKTICIGESEYWWRDGTADSDLIIKGNASTFSEFRFIADWDWSNGYPTYIYYGPGDFEGIGGSGPNKEILKGDMFRHNGSDEGTIVDGLTGETVYFPPGTLLIAMVDQPATDADWQYNMPGLPFEYYDRRQWPGSGGAYIYNLSSPQRLVLDALPNHLYTETQTDRIIKVVSESDLSVSLMLRLTCDILNSLLPIYQKFKDRLAQIEWCFNAPAGKQCDSPQFFGGGVELPANNFVTFDSATGVLTFAKAGRYRVIAIKYDDFITPVWRVRVEGPVLTTDQKHAAEDSTGMELSFDYPRTYGVAAALNGEAFTLHATLPKQRGITQLARHNAAAEPTYPASFKKLTGSGDYVPNVDNFYTFEYFNDAIVLYSINQAT
jgi:hypothetical protein